MQAQSRYRPIRALVGWTLVFAGLWALLDGLAHGAVLSALSGFERSAAIADRFFSNAYQQSLFVLLGGAILFLGMQFLALIVDGRQLHRPHPVTRLEALVGILAGRGRAFWGLDFSLAGARAHLMRGESFVQIPLQVLLWSFPMFGFLGTVYGLSGAVGALSALNAAEGGLQADSLQPVFSELDIAFDTTIQGILSALVLAGLMVPHDIAWTRLRDSANEDDAPHPAPPQPTPLQPDPPQPAPVTPPARGAQDS